MYQEILLEKKDGFAKVIFNRPEARNSITPVLISELAAVLEELSKEESIRAIFLMGSGKDFCTGMDLKYALTTLENNPEEFRTSMNPWGPKIHGMMEDMDKPVIAAVQGNAIAGGFILAYFCDLIIATEDARFGDAHVKWGIVPGWQEPQRLARTIGLRRAKQFFLTCEFISAKEAQEMGLVWKLVPSEKLEEAIDEWGAKFSAFSMTSMGMIKQQFKWVMQTEWHDMLEMDELMRKDLIAGFCSEEMLERLKAFRKK